VLAAEASVLWREAISGPMLRCVDVQCSAHSYLDTFFLGFYPVFKQTLRRFPNSKLLMQPSRFQYIAFNLLAEQKKVTVLNLQIMPFSINEKLKFGHPYCTLLLSAFYRLIHTFSFSFYSYQKDERAKR
jgi:hypothetical protein